LSHNCLGGLCAPGTQSANLPCLADEECRSKRCASKRCAPGPADGGSPDASGPDLNPVDRGPDRPVTDLPWLDAGVPDLPAPDQARPDLPTPDLPTPDLAKPDLPTPDLAKPDLPTPDLTPPDQSLPDQKVPQYTTVGVTVSPATHKNVGDLTVGYGGGNFMVLWEHYPKGPLQPADLYAALVTPAGKVLSSPGVFPVAATAFDEQGPAVAFGAGKFLVGWRMVKTGWYTCEIKVRAVSAAGAPALGVTTVYNINNTSLSGGPALATDGSTFLITFRDESTSKSVRGAALDASGAVTQAFLVPGSANAAEPTAAAYAGADHLIAWEKAGDLPGYVITTKGGAKAAFNLAKTGGNQRHPALAPALGGGAAAVFTDDALGNRILGRFVSAAGGAGSLFLVASGATKLGRPAVAHGGAGAYLAAWESGNSWSDIHAMRFDAKGKALVTKTIVLAGQTLTQDRPAVASDGKGKYLVAWRDQVAGVGEVIKAAVMTFSGP